MTDVRGNQDDNVDAVLKAMGQARIPEGLEARVAEGLERRARAAVNAAEFRWGDVLAGSAAAGVWWRGAASGAAIAILLVGVVAIAAHFKSGGETAVSHAGHFDGPGGAVVGVAQPQERPVPCAGASLMRASRTVQAQRPQEQQPRIEVSARSTPESGPALTRQERDLVRVARIGDLSELATLNPEVRARLEAEEAAQFQSFFAPPAKPVSTDTATEPNVSTQTQGSGSVERTTAEPEAAQPSTETTKGENQ